MEFDFSLLAGANSNPEPLPLNQYTVGWKNSLTLLRIRMRTIIVTLIVLSLPISARAAVTSYLDRGAFELASTTTYQWNFDALAEGVQYHDLLGPDGSTVIPFVLANPTAASIFPPLATISNGCIYFNPQASRAFVFTVPITSFGISIVWGSYYNPAGIGMLLYDAEDNLISEVRTTTADSLSGPFVGTNYEGFLGVVSDTPIASLRFDHVEGSVFFDNAAWTTAPEAGIPALFGTGLLILLTRRFRDVRIPQSAASHT